METLLTCIKYQAIFYEDKHVVNVLCWLHLLGHLVTNVNDRNTCTSKEKVDWYNAPTLLIMCASVKVV